MVLLPSFFCNLFSGIILRQGVSAEDTYFEGNDVGLEGSAIRLLNCEVSDNKVKCFDYSLSSDIIRLRFPPLRKKEAQDCQSRTVPFRITN